jgi:hypothetical protein
MTNTVPAGIGPAVQLQSIWPLGMGPSQDFGGSFCGSMKSSSSIGCPLTISRPCSSQHSMVSPATPITRFTRWPPVG